MDNEHNILGSKGEEMAANMLRNKGYRILERNWSIGDLETDIIAENDEVIVFAEVKTRSANGYRNPEDAVDKKRQMRLTAGAQAYVKMKKIDKPWRFDIFSIVMHAHEPQIIHFEDAFFPHIKTIHSSSFSGENRWKKSQSSTRRRGMK